MRGAVNVRSTCKAGARATPFYALKWRDMSLLNKDTVRLQSQTQSPLLLAVGLFTLILIIFSLYLKVISGSLDLTREQKGQMFAAVSGVVVFGMCCLYYFAYRFYKDSFYLFVSLGWFANIIHVTFETYFISTWGDPHHSQTFGILSSFLMVPFYVAGLMDKDERARRRTWWLRITLGWLVFFIVGTLLVRAFGNDFDEPFRFKLSFLSTVLFSMFTLVTVGMSLKSRLVRDTHGKLKVVYPATFYAYAIIQPCYLLKRDVPWQEFLFAMFVVALFIKVANSLFTMLAMYYYYSDVQEAHAKAQRRFDIESAQLEVAQAKLNERSALVDLGLLTASIQHDIQNPIAVIDSELVKLKERLQAYPDVITRLNNIDELTDKISEATTVVPLLRGSDNYFQKLIQKVALEDLLNGILKMVKREMNTTNIYFRTNWKTDGPKHFIRAYPPLLERAIINIVKNGLEAIREANRASGVIDVKVAEDTPQSEMIRLEFIDNGRGIPAGDLPKVTSLYTTRGDRKANSGIGLYISKRILEVHNGTLKLESEEGVGTVVTFLLPKW